MADILTEIVAHKRKEVERQQTETDIDTLYEQAGKLHNIISFREHLEASLTGIIAEFKRKSPSKGWIHRSADSSVIPKAYAGAGATALSILTDEEYFGGKLDDLRTARNLVSIPLLRKDFIISEYQLHQARAAGADVVLLIAANLSERECRTLARIAHEIGLETLLEVHRESELDYLCDDIDVLGVNNRHLGTFVTEVETSFKLAAKLPRSITHISESGINNPHTVLELRKVGFRGFLMGEHFMREPHPAEALQTFIEALTV